MASCQSPAIRSVTEARIRAAEAQYHNLCISEKELTESSDYAFKTKNWETRMALLTRADAVNQECQAFVANAKIAYAGLPKRERRETLLRLVKQEGYLPSVEPLFFWGLTDADLAPYLAAKKTQPPPIKL